MHILESDRLILRPPCRADVAAMAGWLGDYQVSKNLARVPHPYGEDDAEAFVALRETQDETNYSFTIQRRCDNVLLGGVGLHLEEQGWEFGYWLGRPFWGRGYASEAARRLVGFAFQSLGASHVWAGWYHDNPASGHVLAKLGARHDGSTMRDCRARGGKVLCHGMRLTRADFLRQEAA
jgi:[ribosomal protein S5]-alanine N-acetyltransferase